MRPAQEGSPARRASLFTIAVNLPFLDTLVAGIRAETGDDALALSRITILLPTRRACRALRTSGVARVDFRLGKDGVAHCLEVNTVPGLTELSLVPKAAQAAGLRYEDLVKAIVESAPVRAAR